LEKRLDVFIKVRLSGIDVDDDRWVESFQSQQWEQFYVRAER
jgi:hypothetical protein